jgi:sulfate adenylyltransferase
LLEGAAREAELARAQSLPKIKMSSRETGDLIMMGIGGFTPLEGFMTHGDWQGVCDGYKMANGLFWPIPVTLSTDTKATAQTLKPGTGRRPGRRRQRRDHGHHEGHRDLRHRQGPRVHAMVYKTTDLAHPGVKMVMDQGPINLAGPVKVLSTGGFKESTATSS